MGREDERARIKAQEADIRNFIGRVDRFLFSKLKKILDQIKTGEAQGIEAAQVLGSLQSALKQAGLDQELAEVQRIYGRDLEAIAQRFAELTKNKRIAFTDIDRPMIDALIKGGYDQASTYIERYVGDVREQVALRVLTGDEIDYSAIHEQEMPQLERILDTELSTTLSAFHRSVTVAKAEELGLELYEYVGPKDDKVIREFCEELITGRDPPIYHVDEIRAMPEQNGLPVLQYGGGYNCRHRWNPITEEEARSLGWKP